MEQYNGEPGALRGACPVLREVCADLPPKCGKAALSYSTRVLITILLTAPYATKSAAMAVCTNIEGGIV